MPRRSATRRRSPSSTSLTGIGSASAPAGTAAGLVLRPGLVFSARFVGQLRQVEAVHEIPEDGEALVVHGGLGFVLLGASPAGGRVVPGRSHAPPRQQDRAFDGAGTPDRSARP